MNIKNLVNVMAVSFSLFLVGFSESIDGLLAVLVVGIICALVLMVNKEGIDKKVRNLTNVLTSMTSISVLDTLMDLSISDNAYTLIGTVMIGCIIWLVIIVNK